jgi:hypothetical protein
LRMSIASMDSSSSPVLGDGVVLGQVPKHLEH